MVNVLWSYTKYSLMKSTGAKYSHGELSNSEKESVRERERERERERDAGGRR